ncbi:MAG: PIN domain-containing protein, partial [Gammaproteobacteria bacterium]
MLILVDLNVVLDVIQKRAPHYAASAALIEEIVARRIGGALASHAVTTLHYLVGRHQRAKVVDRTVDWLLRHFDIAAVGRPELLRARALGWNDFEDAVVAA